MSTLARRFAASTVLMLLPALGAAQSRGALQDNMRRLWSDHVTWTRAFIVSTAAALPEKDATTVRLMQNQTDIGDLLASYYGQESGAKLTALLKAHVVIAGDIILAVKANKPVKVDSLDKQWRSNVDEIAVLLNKMNAKNWTVAAMHTAMTAHLEETLAEVQHHLHGDFAADIADFGMMEKHALMMADMLTAGIVAQFPAKFR